MNNQKLNEIEAWAALAIADYNAEAGSGEPPYPNMAADVLELVRMYRALVAHNEMQAAQLRLQAEEMEAIGAGGVDGRRITGWTP